MQVLRLLEAFSQQEVAAAAKDALRLGAISFDAVKHLVLHDWPEGALTASPAGTGSTTPNAPTGLIPFPGSTSPASGPTRTASYPASATSWPGGFPWPPAGVPGSS